MKTVQLGSCRVNLVKFTGKFFGLASNIGNCTITHIQFIVIGLVNEMKQIMLRRRKCVENQEMLVSWWIFDPQNYLRLDIQKLELPMGQRQG